MIQVAIAPKEEGLQSQIYQRGGTFNLNMGEFL